MAKINYNTVYWPQGVSDCIHPYCTRWHHWLLGSGPFVCMLCTVHANCLTISHQQKFPNLASHSKLYVTHFSGFLLLWQQKNFNMKRKMHSIILPPFLNMNQITYFYVLFYQNVWSKHFLFVLLTWILILKMLNELQIGIRTESQATSEIALTMLFYIYKVSVDENEIKIFTYSEIYWKIYCPLHNLTFGQDLIIYVKQGSTSIWLVLKYFSPLINDKAFYKKQLL